MDDDVFSTQITQGHKKEIQRISDLFENKIFIEKLESLKGLSDSKISNALYKLCKKHNLDFDYFFAELYTHIKYDIPINTVGLHKLDMCIVNDDWDENLNPLFQPIPVRSDSSRKIRITHYPISISISREASKRDVLDFVNKQWELIKEMLDVYKTKSKRVRIRTQALRNKFIWENRSKNKNWILNQLEIKFPRIKKGKKLEYGYEDIYTAISNERRRRSEK